MKAADARRQPNAGTRRQCGGVWGRAVWASDCAGRSAGVLAEGLARRQTQIFLPFLASTYRIRYIQWRVEFFDEAIALEVLGWPASLQAALARIVDRIASQGLESLGMPLVRHIEGKLWELRASGKNAEGRALYVGARGRRVVIVLALIKKTEKTPPRIIRLAPERSKDVN